MHFRHNDFARNDSLSTMLPLEAGILPDTLGSSNNGTFLDFTHINILYCARKCMYCSIMDVELRYKCTLFDKNVCQEGKKAKKKPKFHYVYFVYIEILVFLCIAVFLTLACFVA